MSERRFVLADFTHMGREGWLRLYEAGRTYALARAVAHAATKREFLAKQRPAGWTPPSMFRPPEASTASMSWRSTWVDGVGWAPAQPVMTRSSTAQWSTPKYLCMAILIH